MNLLMLAPLRDIDGKIRYVLGAQIDVSNLVPDSTHIKEAASTPQIGFVTTTTSAKSAHKQDESRDSNDMLDLQDRNHIQKWRARTIQESPDDDIQPLFSDRRPRPSRGMSYDSLLDTDSGGWVNSRLSGFYQNVRFL
jgi:hypothetical protein